MGACTSVTRDKDPITATTTPMPSAGVSKVTPFVAFKENKSNNFGELNNSITLNKQLSIRKKKSFKDDDDSVNDD